jgi:hypothetical protein
MCALQAPADKQSSGYKEDSAAHVDGSPEKALDTQIPIEPGSDPPSDSKETVSTILLAQQAREQKAKSSVQQLRARISAVSGTTSADLLTALKDAEDNFVLGTSTAQKFWNCIAEVNAEVDKQSGKADDLSADRKAAHAHTYAIMIVVCALQAPADKQSGKPDEKAANAISIEPGSDPPSDSKKIGSTILLAQQAREQEVKSSMQQLQARISAVPGTTSAGLLSALKHAKYAEDSFVLGTFTAKQFWDCIAECNAKVDKQSGKADDLSADWKAAHAHTYAIMIVHARPRFAHCVELMPRSSPVATRQGRFRQSSVHG